MAPGPAVRDALSRLELPPESVRILAIGKAAIPMASAAIDVLGARGIAPRDGMVVSPHRSGPLHPALVTLAGDHPVPGRRSLDAADQLERFVRAGRADDLVLVLLSGGTSSLIGAPVPPIPPADLATLVDLLLRSGLPIGTVNRIRRRLSRWGAGRLARDLAPARVEVLAISDVPDDDPAAIGSGPCAPDPDTAAAVWKLLRGAGIADLIPHRIAAYLDGRTTDVAAETPKPGEACFAAVTTRIVASNRDAMDAAAGAAAARGMAAGIAADRLAGDAAAMGTRIARALRVPARSGEPGCLIWGGETTVTLGDGPVGVGGRSHELALAAARELAGGDDHWPALLAAGTDGQDGSAPSAGAVVDPATWQRMILAGRDPARDLQRHDSHAALAAAGATLETGPTGTNVMDLVIGVRRPAD